MKNCSQCDKPATWVYSKEWVWWSKLENLEQTSLDEALVVSSNGPFLFFCEAHAREWEKENLEQGVPVTPEPTSSGQPG